jgi:hypothetical protein
MRALRLSAAVLFGLLCLSAAMIPRSHSNLLLGRAAGGGGACSQATTFLARMSGSTTGIQTYICGLVTAGVITGDLTPGGTKCGAILDRLFILAMANSTDARLDVCGNTSATVVGSPTFTADGGYTGIENSASIYLDTGYAPSSGPNILQDDAHISAWSLTNTTAPSGGTLAGTITGSSGLVVRVRAFGDFDFPAVHTSGGCCALNDSDSSGFFINIRTASTGFTAYRNDVSLGSPVVASAGGPPSDSLFILAQNGGGSAAAGSDRMVAMVSAGKSMSGAQKTSMYTLGCALLTARHGSC